MAEEVKQDALAIPRAQTDLIKPNAQAGKLSRLAAFTPVNLTEAIALSKLIANSELAPKDFKGKPANVLIAMQMGAEVGLAPMAAIQNIAVINGRPSIWGDAALAIVQTHPDYEFHKESIAGDGENRVATCQVKRKGHELYAASFSVKQARLAGLWGAKDTWTKYPERMLQMRARGFALRDKFADALRGLNLAEEAMDIAPDNSEAKRKREEGTLDVTAGIETLTPSVEPNRGHNDTGLGKPDSQHQPDPKPDKVMCNECRQIDSHLESCSQYAEWIKGKQDDKTSKPTKKVAVLVVEVREKKKKKPPNDPYLVLDVVYPDNKQDSYFVWHQSFHQYLKGLSDKACMLEISTEGKYLVVQHILEIAGVSFVNDVPASQGTLEMPADKKADEAEDWDVG